VEDTDENITAAVAAMGNADDAVQAVDNGKVTRGTMLPDAEPVEVLRAR
jgi:hypothetical protein